MSDSNPFDEHPAGEPAPDSGALGAPAAAQGAASPEPDPAQLAADLTKPELQAAAAEQGVDVPSGATKADIAAAIVADKAKLAADEAALTVDPEEVPDVPSV